MDSDTTVKEEELVPNKISNDSSSSLSNVNESSTEGVGSNMESNPPVNVVNLMAVATPLSPAPSPSLASPIGGQEVPLSTSSAPETPSVQIKQEDVSLSSEGQIGPALKRCPIPNPLIPKVVEFIDLTVDSDVENMEASSEQSHKRQAIPSRRATRSSTLKRKQMQSNSSDEEEEESQKRPEKIPKVVIDPKKISDSKTVDEIMGKLKEDSNIIEEYRKIIIEKNMTNSAMMPFFKKYGNKVDEIEIVTWIWKSDSTSATANPIDLLKLLVHCKNLSSLTLGPASSARLHNINLDGQKLKLRELRFLSFDTGSPALDQDGRNGFEKILTTIFEAAKNLEILRGKMTTREEFLCILKAMKTSLTSGAVENLNLKPLKNLTTFSIGGGYAFSNSKIQTNIMVPNGAEIRIEGNEKSLQMLEFKLPMLPNLETIRLGSLCYIDRLSPQYFPKLKSLRIGGPWNASLDFLKEDMVFPGVTELQFPDSLKDTSFSARIPFIFPNLKQVRIFFPSGKVLQSFILALEKLGLIESVKLQLKTQFDFESNFRACAIKRAPGVGVEIKPYEREIIGAINRYKYRDEFLAFYNIELPEEESRPEDNLGYPGLRNFLLFHDPRTIRIPEGRHYWYDPRCKLTDYVVGCDANKSPLSWRCMKEDFPMAVGKCEEDPELGPEVRIEPSAVRLGQLCSKTETV